MFSISESKIEEMDLKSSLRNPASGAMVTFEGWVRNHNEGMEVISLEYEAYETLANKEGLRILEEAKEKFGILESSCIHRIGKLEIGEIAVWVGVSSKHRDEGFKACRYIIDEIKLRLPIWKKEYYVNGDSGWVNCQHCASHS